MEIGSRGKVSQFLHVTALLNALTGRIVTFHWSIALTCINKFAIFPHDYPSLLSLFIYLFLSLFIYLFISIVSIVLPFIPLSQYH